MKKLHMVFAIIACILLISQNIFAQELENNSLIASGSSVSVELKGRVETSIISVVMPTKVEFSVLPENENWNKILSPDFTIRNVGNVMLNISISKVELSTSGVEFTTDTPAFNDGIKQIRIAMAPKNNYTNISNINNYLFNNNLNDSNPIVLADALDYSLSNNSETFSIYGDISSGWQNGDEFNINTVFRVGLKH